MITRFAWYRLVDPNGNPYLGTTSATVSVSKETLITHLAESVFAKNITILSSIAPSILQVYAIRGENGLQRLLRHDCEIGDLGYIKDSALYVVVPSLPQGPSSLNHRQAMPTPRLRWSPKVPDSIYDGPLKGNNRTVAMIQLLEIHRDNFSTRASRGPDLVFRLGLIHNLYDSGKTTFAHRYIRMCKSSEIFRTARNSRYHCQMHALSSLDSA